MKLPPIQTPIWSTRSIGIAEYRAVPGNNDFEILAKDKGGHRFYPHLYTITGKELSRYPVQITGSIKLRIIPIADLNIKEYRNA